MNAEWFRKAVLLWFTSYGRSFPWRTPGIEPLQGLITELLLRKTTARQVENVYVDVIKTSLSETLLGEQSLAESLEVCLTPLGLQTQRAQAIVSVFESIVARGDQATFSLAELLSLPHVGPYLANATRCFYLGCSSPIVDTNISRLFSRFFFGTEEESPNPCRIKRYWLIASALLDRDDPKGFNWGLLDLGSLVCTTSNPKCCRCPLLQWCKMHGASRWGGISENELQSLSEPLADTAGMSSRFAEIAGLDSVPPKERLLKLAERHDMRHLPDRLLSELQLRELALRHYCGKWLEVLSWVYTR